MFKRTYKINNIINIYNLAKAEHRKSRALVMASISVRHRGMDAIIKYDNNKKVTNNKCL